MDSNLKFKMRAKETIQKGYFALRNLYGSKSFMKRQLRKQPRDCPVLGYANYGDTA